ncbi:MAG: hypothetical protein J7M12_04960 [Candidatus Hydrogenedentes bacterium]|nr:hypothetical protein [Candidatus Hydrogenedentota bacterium]
MRGASVCRHIVLSAVLWSALAAGVHASVEPDRWELWPIIDRIKTPETSSLTVRPLFKVSSDRQDIGRRVDVLYPFFKWERHNDGDLQCWLAPLVYHIVSVNPYGRVESDTAVLPIFFSGSTSDGSEDYMAVFPLGGTVKDFMGVDEAHCVLFPLYVHIKNKGYDSRSVLWPIFEKGTGKNRSGWRVWPLYGERRTGGKITYRTVLWPIYTRWQNKNGNYLLVFPLYYKSDTASQKVRSIIPPLFVHAENWKKHETAWYLPWPFIEIVRSPTSHVNRYWPIWGAARRGDRNSMFVLWPLYMSSEKKNDEIEKWSRRSLIATLSTGEKDLKTGATDRYFQLWPLFHWSKQTPNDRSEFNLLSPLWFRYPSERFREMYGPLWTLYRHERKDGLVTDEVLSRVLTVERSADRHRVALWPLFSVERDSGRWNWDLLKGLVGRHDGETQVLWMLKFKPRQ